ncbi:sensor histidine kinase [Glacieibacterium sp.]|uniref:sensor histidine kinase n=1 Tax=Glacieibacterium sp. TaxID=2860237 RepID=UPI003AFFEEF2
MAGRIFVVLIVGIAAAALLASALAGIQRRAEVAAERADRIVDRIVAVLESDPPPPGTRRLDRLPSGIAAPAIAQRIAARISDARDVAVVSVDAAVCARVGPSPPPPPPIDQRRAPSVGPELPRPLCYAVRLAQGAGRPVAFAVDAPPRPGPSEPIASTAFLAALAIATVALALIVARMAARPIARLGAAAQDLAADLDASPVAESGPGDVRRAIAAFNDMQVQLRRTVEERTYMLAAISHDLRSPLTRMRLRLDGIDDARLRDKLVTDVQAMTVLIEEGLELARLSRETDAALVPVDIAALVASLCEDAQDVGQPVSFEPSTRIVERTQADALRRIVTNLIDNALLYGGEARVWIDTDDGATSIHIADRGPGIPIGDLDRVFDPFRRLDTARTGGQGSGLGLTIARLLARRIGCTIGLRNRQHGGLFANVTFARPAAPREAAART